MGRQQPLRKSEPDAHMQLAHAEAANENLTEEKLDARFEKEYLSDFPKFTTHKDDMRALGAFRREFKLYNYDNLNVFVLLRGDEKDVSADRVFSNDDENNVVFYTTRRAVQKSLQRRGHEARKENVEQQHATERADVFIALDPTLKITDKLDGHIDAGGWVLCRIGVANSLRTRGKYTFKGVIEKTGGTAHMSRRDEAGFWKSVQADSEESFRQAGKAENPDIADYQYAQEKVKEAKRKGIKGMSETDIFASYSKLIELAESDNAESVARGETTLSLTRTVNEKEVTVDGILTVLTMKKGEHDDKMIVMRKNLTG